MDYTSLARVKLDFDAQDNSADVSLQNALTGGSRSIDRITTQIGDPSSDNYLALESKTNEFIMGRITRNGSLVVNPHKPNVVSVGSMQFRINPRYPWTTIIDVSQAILMGSRVEVYDSGVDIWPAQEAQVLISYTGGLAPSGSAFPDDIQECATLLAIRHYKEAQTGLSDAIGVAELGQMVYTKAYPVRALKLLEPYMRRVGWYGSM